MFHFFLRCQLTLKMIPATNKKPIPQYIVHMAKIVASTQNSITPTKNIKGANIKPKVTNRLFANIILLGLMYIVFKVISHQVKLIIVLFMALSRDKSARFNIILCE